METPIRSKALRILHNSIKKHSYDTSPFYNINFSEAKAVPTIDFTLWISDRIINNDLDAVIELFYFLNNEIDARNTIQGIFPLDFSTIIDSLPNLLAELKAATMLAHRIPSLDTYNKTFILSRIYTVILSAYRFTLKNGFQHEPTQLGLKLKAIPPAFRAGLYSSILKATPGAFKFISWCIPCEYGWVDDYRDILKPFVKKPAVEFMASKMQKDKLCMIAASESIDVKKSWKKDKIIETLLANEVCAEIIEKDALEWITDFVNPICDKEFYEWADDMNKLESISKSLIAEYSDITGFELGYYFPSISEPEKRKLDGIDIPLTDIDDEEFCMEDIDKYSDNGKSNDKASLPIKSENSVRNPAGCAYFILFIPVLILLGTKLQNFPI